MTDAVNRQITDAVTQSNTNVLGGSPAQSMGLVYQTTAHSISLILQNAVAAQSSMQQVNAAVISTACRQIISLPSQIGVAPTLTENPTNSSNSSNSPNSPNPPDPSASPALPSKPVEGESSGEEGPEQVVKERIIREYL